VPTCPQHAADRRAPTLTPLAETAGRRSRDQSRALVLVSGGLDSAVALALAREDGFDVVALHVSYGQAAEHAEADAAAAIAAAADVPLRRVSYRGAIAFQEGEIRGRNAFLVQIALLEFPWPSGAVMLGIHAGTSYADCAPPFVDLMQRVLDFHCNGHVALVAPLLDLRKGDIARLAAELDVPVELTHSCEAANGACGVCQSCRDRSLVLAENDARA
jgi:7-cyano-7-deazaguanine synthase